MPHHYTSVAKTLHWTVAAIMITMLIFGQGFEGSDGADLAFSLTGHSSLGFIVIALILLRIFWRLGHSAPALPESTPQMQRIAARLSHLALLAVHIGAALLHQFVQRDGVLSRMLPRSIKNKHG